MDFDTFIGQAWADHADAAPAVAGRLADGIALVGDAPQLTRLAELAHHVHGAHLADWRGGAAFIERLAALPQPAPDAASASALRRCLASLALCERADSDLSALAPAERIRVTAMAAANLADPDAPRAAALLRAAVEQAERAGLAPTDSAHRQLAVAANNIAAALEEKPRRSTDERALMIQAAQTARRYWALAGTWLETERAEYRLALTWLQAGDPDRARIHAQACLEIVSANDGAPIERLFAWEAVGRAERAAGNAGAHAAALAQARAALEHVDAADRDWCAASVDALAA